MPADDCEAVFVTEAGVEHRVPWRRLPDVVDDLGRPVRSFRSYRGKRSFPGFPPRLNPVADCCCR